MKKRVLSLLIAGVMTASLLSGCGVSEDIQDQSDTTAQSDQFADETSSDIEANTEDTSDGGTSDGKRWWYTIPQQEILKLWQIILRTLQEAISLNWSR